MPDEGRIRSESISKKNAVIANQWLSSVEIPSK